MTELVHAEAARFEEADRVMTLYTKNYTPLQIVRETGLTRKAVDSHINEWRESIVNSSFVKNRVEELLAQMDDHFGSLVKELHFTLDAIPKGNKDPQLMAQRTAAVKAIAEVTTKRIDALQKAGLLDAADLGDEIAETEEKIKELTDLLTEVTESCNKCGPMVRERISALMGRSVGHDL